MTQPRISSIQPLWAIKGGRVTIEGTDLVPDPTVPPTVSLGSRSARVVRASGRVVSVIVPDEVEGGHTAVRLEGALGETPFIELGVRIATGLHQVDSPAIDGEGRLYLTYSGARGEEAPVSLFRVGRDGFREPFVSGIMNATSLAFSPEGRLHVSSRFEGTVYRVASDGRHESLTTELGVTCGLAFAPDGTLYVGDRSGTIFRVGPSGRANTFATLPASVAAFHLAWGPDDALYVTAPTLSSRDSVYRVDHRGSVDRIYSLFGRPQGLAFDSNGVLYVVEALAGLSGVFRIESDGSATRVLAASSLIGLAFEPAGGLSSSRPTQRIGSTYLCVPFTSPHQVQPQLTCYHHELDHLARSATALMSHDWIDVRGARVHNLKNIDVKIPRDQLVVVTGLSGSGKSSLAFDTVYAEGQRRYVESLSAYARQFLEQVEKPDVDQIDGLSPAISIEQRTTGSNPRSTVGTVTEIYDYLRLLFANIGVPHCPTCDQEVTSQSVDQIVQAVMRGPHNERVNVLAPVVRGRKGEFKKELEGLHGKGLLKARVDGDIRSLEDPIRLDRRKNHWIDAVVDRLVLRAGAERRLTESIGIALALADEVVIINTLEGGDRLFSRRLACVTCGINMLELTARVFSFNSLHGACVECQGLGEVEDFDPTRIVPDETKSLADGAIEPWVQGDRKMVRQALAKLSRHFDIRLDVPFARLSRKRRGILLYGPGGIKDDALQPTTRRRGKAKTKQEPFGRDFEGIIPNFRRRFETGTWEQQEALEPYRSLRPCRACDGHRLRPESRAVRVKGHTIADYVSLPIVEARASFDALELDPREALIADRVLREIRERLRFLTNVGVGYLTLARGAATLSGGEAQRIRLATQIGSNLTGVLYVLDEPSIGLHQRDNRLLLGTLARLRDLGNTVLVVEHDEETIRAADYVIDLGLGAGEHGGRVIFQGAPSKLVTDGDGSLTGQYLRGERTIAVPTARRPALKGGLMIRGARANNLKAIDVNIPLGLFTAVSGVSGSGKSTLINDILYKSLARELHRATQGPGIHDSIDGLDLIDKVIQIDQSPIGRTPRSNPATYTGLFTFIRELFSMLSDSRARGYKPGRFSFNVKGGRCEACKGDGVIAIEMHFLPDVYVTCEQCKGRRYNRETLEIAYRGVSIGDMLELTVDQAMPLLENFPPIATKLATLQDVGLGYVQLGQSATTLSGGEAQRVKLAKELSRRSTGRTLYILDEPTTGLHFDDTRHLLEVLNKLVDQGNTVVVIEHQLDVIKSADHVIDLGPEGGEAGGWVIAEGTPEEVAEVEGSYTGHYLKSVLVS